MNPTFTTDAERYKIAKEKLVKITNLSGATIDEICKYGFISGSALQYAIERHSQIDPDTIDDLDVYVNTKENFYKIFNHLKDCYYPNNLCAKSGFVYNEEKETETNESILELDFNKRILTVQLIYFEGTMDDILEYVDFDCCQCIMHDRAVTMSDWCQEALKTKRIRYFSKYLKHRVEKLISKYFKVSFIPSGPKDMNVNGRYFNPAVDFELGKPIVFKKPETWYDLETTRCDVAYLKNGMIETIVDEKQYEASFLLVKVHTVEGLNGEQIQIKTHPTLHADSIKIHLCTEKSKSQTSGYNILHNYGLVPEFYEMHKDFIWHSEHHFKDIEELFENSKELNFILGRSIGIKSAKSVV